jgi:aspartyl-tRNA(Asn)/glutamyl-tRNA(Gln) amidotransferase subunit B
MRSKENTTDYRFMPEPDLPNIYIAEHQLDALRAQIQEFPVHTIQRYKQDYQFNKEYIN